MSRFQIHTNIACHYEADELHNLIGLRLIPKLYSYTIYPEWKCNEEWIIILNIVEPIHVDYMYKPRNGPAKIAIGSSVVKLYDYLTKHQHVVENIYDLGEF